MSIHVLYFSDIPINSWQFLRHLAEWLTCLLNNLVQTCMHVLQNIKKQNYSTKNIHRVLILTKQYVQTCMYVLQNIKKNYLTKNIHSVLIITKHFCANLYVCFTKYKKKLLNQKYPQSSNNNQTFLCKLVCMLYKI